MVPIAQLAEHLTVDQKVVGSRPIGHPRRWPQGHFFFFLLLAWLLGACQTQPTLPPLSTPPPTATTTIPFPPSPTLLPAPTATPSLLERLRIVYVTPDGLWLWEAAATRPLTFHPQDSEPRFSSDGEQIAFLREGELWRVTLQGETLRLVGEDYLALVNPGKSLRLQAWSWMPGTANLFFTTAELTPNGWQPRFDLHVVDARLGNPIMVLAAGEGGIPYFSPSGRRLALVRAGNLALTPTSGRLNPRTAFSFRAPPNYLPTPHWLRDESGVVLFVPPPPDQATPTPEPSAAFPALLPTRWWGIPVEGNPRLLGEFEAEAFERSQPLVSPNGDQVLYLYPYRKRGQYELHLRDVRGNDLVYTTYRYGQIGLVAWLPNETHFIYWADTPQSLWLAHYGEPGKPLTPGLDVDALFWVGEQGILFRSANQLYFQTWEGERRTLAENISGAADLSFSY